MVSQTSGLPGGWFLTVVSHPMFSCTPQIQTLVETFFVWLHCVLLIACGCVVVVVSCPYAIIPLSVIAAPEILFILGHGRTYR